VQHVPLMQCSTSPDAVQHVPLMQCSTSLLECSH
jgi:hypothetical protein